ncbi:hypothetical protein D9M68_894360 [compost metagenome]
MEARELAGGDQARHDEFDVHVGRVVAQVHQALRFRAQGLRGEEAGTPVLDDGGVESRLADLVLQHHAPVARQGRVDLLRALQVAVEGAAEVLLTGEVAAVADPHR